MSEVMFCHARNISGENPKHIEWIYNTAIPIIEKKFGYNVIIVKDESDYLQEFYQKITKPKDTNRIGKYSGFFIGGMCIGNSRLKMRPLRKFFKNAGDCEQIVGIACDETERLKRLKHGKISLLAEFGITECMTYDMCRRYNLLSPIYEERTRGGVGFARIAQ